MRVWKATAELHADPELARQLSEPLRIVRSPVPMHCSLPNPRVATAPSRRQRTRLHFLAPHKGSPALCETTLCDGDHRNYPGLISEIPHPSEGC